MVWLWQLGGMIEQRRGWWRFLLLVLACAIPSNVAQWFLSEFSWNAGHLVIQSNHLFGGMSGVVYGLFGYVWMKGRYDPDLGMQLGSRTVVYMLVWLVLCATGLVGPIANTAHAVGLVVGVVIGILPHWWRLLFSR
jgi:GlpG protein